MRYIYKFFNKQNECVYVGKTTHLKSRFYQHSNTQPWFNEVTRIEYAQCVKEFMIDIYELFYINTIKPKYNKKDTKIQHMNFDLDELNFKIYKKFIKENNFMIRHVGSKELYLKETEKLSKIDFFNFHYEAKPKKSISHHILLVDCSGSMRSHIEELKKQILSVTKVLLTIPDSFVSIITYSGHNQASTILSAIKCEKSSYGMSRLEEVIEKEISAKGVTVISEPLNKAIDNCRNLVGICNKNHIVLFTDGCLVSNLWSFKEEEERCYDIAKICNKENIFLNAIGFGQYYDRKFLNKLVSIAGNGKVAHIDEIEDYHCILISAINEVNDTDQIKTQFKSDGIMINLTNGELHKNELTCISADGNIAVFNHSFFALDEDITDCNNKEYDNNGNIYTTNATIDDNDELITSFYLSMAKNYLNEEDIENAEFMVKASEDIALYEKTRNCYSFIEKGRNMNLLSNAIRYKNLRFEKGRKAMDLNINDSECCVLELLNAIMNDENSSLLWINEKSSYHRIGQKVDDIEDNISFENSKEQFNKVSSISIGSEKLNIGVKVIIEGNVIDKISKISKPAKIFRDYNIINGGNINVPYICFESKNPNVILSMLPDNVKYECIKDGIYKIHLSGIKTTNKRILKSLTLSEIRDHLKQIAISKCHQTVLNKKIKDVVGNQSKLDFCNLSPEDLEINKILRINEKGVYSPVSTEKNFINKFEVYPAIFMTWELKVPEKKIKDEYSKLIQDINNFNELSKLLNELKTSINKLELKVNMVRLASGIMNKNVMLFDMETEKDKTVNDKILEINTVVNGKVKEWKKVMSEDILIQRKWLQLIKCN